MSVVFRGFVINLILKLTQKLLVLILHKNCVCACVSKNHGWPFWHRGQTSTHRTDNNVRSSAPAALQMFGSTRRYDIFGFSPTPSLPYIRPVPSAYYETMLQGIYDISPVCGTLVFGSPLPFHLPTNFSIYAISF